MSKEQKAKLKPRGGNSPIKGDIVTTEPGDNALLVMFNKSIMDLTKIDLHNIKCVKARIDEFFEMCKTADQRPTVSALAMSLGLDRRRLWELANDQHSNASTITNMPTLCKDAITDAYKLMELMWESLAIHGRMNPAAMAFFGVNNFKYQDVSKVIIAPEPADPLGEKVDVENLKARYLAAIPEGYDDE